MCGYWWEPSESSSNLSDGIMLGTITVSSFVVKNKREFSQISRVSQVAWALTFNLIIKSSILTSMHAASYKALIRPNKDLPKMPSLQDVRRCQTNPFEKMNLKESFCCHLSVWCNSMIQQYKVWVTMIKLQSKHALISYQTSKRSIQLFSMTHFRIQWRCHLHWKTQFYRHLLLETDEKERRCKYRGFISIFKCKNFHSAENCLLWKLKESLVHFAPKSMLQAQHKKAKNCARQLPFDVINAFANFKLE